MTSLPAFDRDDAKALLKFVKRKLNDGDSIPPQLARAIVRLEILAKSTASAVPGQRSGEE